MASPSGTQVQSRVALAWYGASTATLDAGGAATLDADREGSYAFQARPDASRGRRKPLYPAVLRPRVLRGAARSMVVSIPRIDDLPSTERSRRRQQSPRSGVKSRIIHTNGACVRSQLMSTHPPGRVEWRPIYIG